jgi:hypothetical protein
MQRTQAPLVRLSIWVALATTVLALPAGVFTGRTSGDGRFGEQHNEEVARDFGGGVTQRSDGTLSGHIQTVVDPNGLRKPDEAPRPTLGEAVAHEFGHALGFEWTTACVCGPIMPYIAAKPSIALPSAV